MNSSSQKIMRRNHLLLIVCLVVFWLSLNLSGVAPRTAYTQNAQTALVEEGRKLFAPTCASGYCHGPNGKDGSAPALQGRTFTAEHLTRVIADGVPGTPMPAFKQQFTSAQIQQLVAYVMSLPKGNAPATSRPTTSPEAAAAARRRGADDQATTDVLMPTMKEVTAERLNNAAKEPQNWMTYFGTYDAQRYSTLNQINRTNVKNLAPAWAFQTGKIEGGLNAAPLVVDGVMYLVGSYNRVFALDAATGKRFWHYFYKLPTGPIPYGTSVRGIAIGYGLVFMGTLDNHLVALDAKTGREVWKVEIENYQKCGCNVTAAPIVVKDNVIVGVTGGDSAHRGYLSAYNARTGKLDWRFYTIPAPGEPGSETWEGDSWKYGGGATWMTGSYDPELNLIYWGIGNPSSDFYGGDREGTNLYTGCVVALDADTGKLKWHYQEVPHDVYDFDAAYEATLIDVVRNGQTQKLLVHTNKGGYVWALDRVTGKYVNAWPHVETVNWLKGFEKDGTHIGRLEVPLGKTTEVCPYWGGGRSWNHQAYSPRTGWLYNHGIEWCGVITPIRQEPKEGRGFVGGLIVPKHPPSGQAYAHIDAFDPISGAKKWTVKMKYPLTSSLLATAGDLLFTADIEGNFLAYDAKTGAQLYSFNTGSGTRGSPITYAVNGRQYIAVPSGLGSIFTGGLGTLWPEARNFQNGSTLFVFALPASNKSK